MIFLQIEFVQVSKIIKKIRTIIGCGFRVDYFHTWSIDRLLVGKDYQH